MLNEGYPENIGHPGDVGYPGVNDLSQALSILPLVERDFCVQLSTIDVHYKMYIDQFI